MRGAVSTLKRALTLDPNCDEAKSLLLWCYGGFTDEQYEAIPTSKAA
jgi:hypothetical protein